jgi:hypothetical protein
LRRTASRRGYELRKTPRRDVLAVDYGIYTVLRDGKRVFESTDLDAIERFLNG